MASDLSDVLRDGGLAAVADVLDVGGYTDPAPPLEVAPVVDTRQFGIKCDGVTDDTQGWHDLTEAVLGHPALMEGGRVFIPGPSVVSDTIEFRKFSGELFGSGWGRGGGAFLWDGPAGVPVLRLRESQGSWLHDFRVTGSSDESQKPSALIEMYNWLGGDDPDRDAWSQAHNRLERLWLGRHAHEGGRDEITHHGLLWTGNNTNNDHNTVIDCKILHGTGAAIRQEGSQNVLNKYIGGIYNGFAVGMDTNATVTMDNPSFNRMSDVDVLMRQGQKLHVKQWHSEHAGGMLRMESGGHVIVDQGTWQCYPDRLNPGYSMFDGRVIEAPGSAPASIELRNVLFGIARLDAAELAGWRIDLGDGGSKYLRLAGCNQRYGGNSLDESNFVVGSGYRLVEGHWFGGQSFRNVLESPSDVLSFSRFDGSS